MPLNKEVNSFGCGRQFFGFVDSLVVNLDIGHLLLNVKHVTCFNKSISKFQQILVIMQFYNEKSVEAKVGHFVDDGISAVLLFLRTEGG